MGNLLNPIPVVCERLGLGRSVVYELMDRGAIESVKVGRRRLVPEMALQDFVERLRSESLHEQQGRSAS